MDEIGNRRMSEVSEDPVSTTRYWCHLCTQAVTPTMEPEIKCPYCDSGFVEEMQGRDFEPTTTDLRSQRPLSLSLWAPILLGMVDDNTSSASAPTRRLRRPARTEPEEDPEEQDDDDDEEEEEEEEDDEIEREIEDIFRRSRRRSAVLQLLESLRDDERDGDRERDREREGLGDYFLGPGLDLLLQHLAENDPNRYGTPPAKKEAVEALPCTIVQLASSCAVCLDDFEIGSEAKQLPCRHKFHGGCILPWLELHSTCPICRYQLPAEDTKDNGEGTGEGSGESGIGYENRPWINEIFSSSDGSQHDAGADLSEEQDSHET